MREYDDNNIQHYAPVLRRIIILVAVITAVPVVLWTITAFMRTYIAQPTIPDAKPLAVVTSDVTPTQNQGPTASIAAPPPATAGATATDDPNKGNRTNDSAGNAPDGKTTATAVSQPAPTPSPSTSPWPSTSPTVTATTQPSPTPGPAAANVFPDPPALAAPTTAQQAGPATTSDLAADDSLPPPDPITGPVPIPRHRPAVLALVETGSVPLPRARPADAPEPPNTMTDAPPPVYDPGIGGAR
jgi:hypothetical protein